MPFYTFKVLDIVNNYYLYVISRLNDPELTLEHVEHASALHPEDPINSYFNFIGWESITIQPADNIKPADIANNTLPADDKCMNLSESYLKLIVVPEKKKREPKKKDTNDTTKKVKPPAKVTKQKTNKQVHIENDQTKTGLAME